MTQPERKRMRAKRLKQGKNKKQFSVKELLFRSQLRYKFLKVKKIVFRFAVQR